MKNIDFMRKRFESAKTLAKSSKNAPQLSQIRVCLPFEKGKGVYNIDIKKDKNHVLNRLLKDNDLFVVAGAHMGIMVEKNTLPGHAPILSYPLSADYPSEGVYGLSEANSAYVLYNGQWSLRTNQDVNFQAFPTSVFLHLPNSLAVVGGETPYILGAVNNIEDAMFSFPEEVTLNGQEDHEIRIEFPATADTAIQAEDTGLNTAFLVFTLLGWTIQGAAK